MFYFAAPSPKKVKPRGGKSEKGRKGGTENGIAKWTLGAEALLPQFPLSQVWTLCSLSSPSGLPVRHLLVPRVHWMGDALHFLYPTSKVQILINRLQRSL